MPTVPVEGDEVLDPNIWAPADAIDLPVRRPVRVFEASESGTVLAPREVERADWP